MKANFILSKHIKPLPQVLIYKKPSQNGYTQYNMINIKDGKCVGKMLGGMRTEPPMCSSYYPSIEGYHSFFIGLLQVKNKRHGYGSEFIKLAKAESMKNGGNGRVHLDATCGFDPQHPAHIFYRKLGFTSQFEETIKVIDKAIKQNKMPNWQQCPDTPMYLMENQRTAIKKPTIWNKIKNFLQIFKKQP